MTGIAPTAKELLNRPASTSQFRHHFISSTITKVLVLGMGFLVSVLIARFLTPQGVGTLSLVMTVPLIVCSFSNLGIRQALTYYVGKGLANTRQLFQALLRLWLGSTVLAMIVAGGSYIILDYTRYGWVLLAAGISTIPFTVLTGYLEGFAMGSKAIPKINAGRLVNVVTYLAMVLLLAGVLRLGAKGAIFALLTSLAVQSFVLLRATLPHAGFALTVQPGLVSDLIRRGIPYAAGLLVFQLNYRINILLLGYFVDRADIGHFTIGVTLAELLWQLPTVLSFVIFAHGVSVTDQAKFSGQVWRAAWWFTVAAFGAAVIIAILVPYVVPLIYGDAYAPSVLVIWALLPGIVVAVAFKTLAGDLAARGRPLVGAGAFSVALIVNVPLNLILIPSHGVLGAAISSSISYCIGTLIFLQRYRSITNLSCFSRG